MKAGLRVGLGYDIHRLVDGRALWLGGIRLDHSHGLEGHSDADALLHAVTDAILGAAGLPDIGHYFPPSDPKIKGIASSEMLAKAVSEAKKAGFSLVNVDGIIIAEVPKIGPYREAMRNKLAELLGIAVDEIQIKGKTNEGLDAIGERRAIAAQAVVLLQKVSSF